MSELPKRIAIFEDEPASIINVRRVCAKYGWELVATATTMEEAEALVPQLEQLGVLLALVDGNLSEDEWDAHEGAHIVEQIKTSAPGVQTIGFSGDKGKPDGVDFQLGKEKFYDSIGTILNSYRPRE